MSGVIGISEEKVTIDILGEAFLVPKDKLLYVFQDLEMLRAKNRFCWNGDCRNCVIRFKTSEGGPEITERACQTSAAEGLIVTRMPSKFYRKHGKQHGSLKKTG